MRDFFFTPHERLLNRKSQPIPKLPSLPPSNIHEDTTSSCEMVRTESLRKPRHTNSSTPLLLSSGSMLQSSASLPNIPPVTYGSPLQSAQSLPLLSQFDHAMPSELLIPGKRSFFKRLFRKRDDTKRTYVLQNPNATPANSRVQTPEILSPIEQRLSPSPSSISVLQSQLDFLKRDPITNSKQIASLEEQMSRMSLGRATSYRNLDEYMRYGVLKTAL